MDKMNPANISPSRVTALYNERDRLRAKIKRLRALVGRLVSEAHGSKPYAHTPPTDTWECCYCEDQWQYGGGENHADDCPVVLARAMMAEEDR